MFGQNIVHSGPILNSFGSVSDDEVLQLINKMPSKSSPRDIFPVSLLKHSPRDIFPISLLKRSADVFAPVVARIANLSLSEGCFPRCFKMTQVSNVTQKTETGLHGFNKLPTNFKFVDGSKLVERLVLVRLRSYLLASVNFNPLQSAYRTGHSNETAIIEILDDFYACVNNKTVDSPWIYRRYSTPSVTRSYFDFVTTSGYVLLHSNGLTRMYQIVNNLSRWVNTQHRLHTIH